MKIKCWIIAVSFLVSVWPVAPAASADWTALRNRVHTMMHGVYTAEQWDRVLSELDEHADEASLRGDYNREVEIRLLQAQALRQSGEHAQALALLGRMIRQHGSEPVRSLRRIYVKKAEMLAALNDPTAIRKLIDDYRNSPHYEGSRLVYSGGRGRDEPLRVMRPSAAVGESVTETALRRILLQAEYSAGRRLPDFRVATFDGSRLAADDLRGQVVLLDFWVSSWPQWRGHFPLLKRLQRDYADRGLYLLGCSLGPDVRSEIGWIRREKGGWPQVHPRDCRGLAAKFGVFGQPDNILVGRDGIILGRGLRGQSLLEAVRAAIDAE